MTSSSSGPAGVQPIRAALLTPPGRGAIAVIGVAGIGAADLVGRLFAARGAPPLNSRPDGAVVYGTWTSSGEDVVVVRYAADRLEIHGHGGIAAPAAVLAGLLAAGARPGRWQEWCGRGPCAREAVEALPAAAGPKAARLLARQASGILDREFDRHTAAIARGDRDEARRIVARLRAASRVGARLATPWQVVVAGEVNAGKSSLVNAILGHGRSIVSPVPGTTRDVLVAATVLRGWAVDLVDTAGSRIDHPAGSATEREGIARGAEAARRADLVVRVIPPGAEPPPPAWPGTPELLVRSKADLAGAPPAGDFVVTSAVTGQGIDAVIDAIVTRLVPEESADPALLAGPVPFAPRQMEVLERLDADAQSCSSCVAAPALSPVPRPRT